ncbi:MAG TPA: hypothetical protein ENK43_02000 [Planctomycetes bacterium]|nr:hypothetical protein [Planctomycetota bacterium]
MQIEKVFLIPLAPETQRRLYELGLIDMDRALHGQGYLERRFPAHSDEAKAFEESLNAQGVDYWVRDERHFTRKELRSARALHLDSFHQRPEKALPTLSTEWDWSEACTECMRVPSQVGVLEVRAEQTGGRNLIRGRRGEILVTEKIARRMIADGISGCLLQEVRVESETTAPSPPYYQVVPTHTLPQLASPPTRFGVTDDFCHRCGLGGLFLESMLYLSCDDRELQDINVTRELFGEGAQLSPEVILSPRFYNLLVSCGVQLDEPEPVLFV